MSDILQHPVHDASAWVGADLERNRDWEFELSAAQSTDLVDALQKVRKQGLDYSDVRKEAFPLPQCQSVLTGIGQQLETGRGFALLHGFPVESLDYEDIEILYWGFCSHIGTGMTQNGDGGLIHYVTDGSLKPSQGTRGVGFPKTSPLHVDLTDIVSLLCVRQAPDDPPSRVSSAVTLHNEILAQHPETLPRLYHGYPWDRMEENAPEESVSTDYPVPVFSHINGQISCRYNRHWMASAATRHPEGLGAEDAALFDMIDELAFKNCFEFPFHRGDIQFCNNYTVFHGRAAHNVVQEEQRKRVLLRIWLNRDGLRTYADEGRVRFGIGYHGQLGWTAQQVAQGLNATPHPRNSDGTVVMP